jgi:catechol 2,3-dioxygenase-like lactoylglutathione lyase family enzyme
MTVVSTEEDTGMSRVSMIHHLNVQIRNRERTQEWYQKVLGVEFIDRGSGSNQRQLQLYLGTGEIHFTETPEPQAVSSNHFALEIPDWEGMLAHLETIGVPYAKPGTRNHNGSYSTYIHDPDNNMIELVHHPLGLHWAQTPGIRST